MTTIQQIEQFADVATDSIIEEFYGDPWRSTSLLIQLLTKQESYYESLSESEPDSDLYTGMVAMSSALELINSSYSVPVTDDKFEDVEKMYDAVVVTWIRDVSDDALADLVYLGHLSNFVAEMRVAALDQYISETGPSEDKFKALKFAKRDAKAVQLATQTCAEVLLNNDEN